MLKHIVFFKFKPENIDHNIQKLTALLEELPFKIKELNSIEIGRNIKDSDRSMELSLYSTFNTVKDLEAYAIHPAHLEAVKLIKEVTIESRVVDYIN